MAGQIDSTTLRGIPIRGFGTFQPDPGAYPDSIVKDSVLAALRLGYRHIDTAWAYGNGQVERAVGEAVRESGLARSELFIVSKLHNTFHETQDVEVGLDWTLKNLGMDYVDLFLMHNPYAYAHDNEYATLRNPDGSGKPLMEYNVSKRYPDTWKAMTSLVSTGKVREVGVSNFNVLKLKRLIAETNITPSVNQVEFNPYFPQKPLLAFCKNQGIQLVAHCPLGGSLAPAVAGRKGTGPLEDPLITQIAARYQKTAAQTVLAWIIGRGVCVIPKSNNVARIAENFDCLFSLSEDEDRQIGDLMGVDGEKAIRNLESRDHIGFDVYDEFADQPV